VWTGIKIHLLSKINKCLARLKSPRLPPTFRELPCDKVFTLSIPTCEGSGQAVHPDILCRSGNSPAFVLAFTPYPFSLDRFENPSVAVSDDGLRFVEEYPGANPLAAAPPRDHNNDPDLFYYEDKLRMIYLETLRPEKQNLVLLTRGGDGRWSSRIVHTDYLQAGDPLILSPVYARIQHREYFFYVNNTERSIQFVPLGKNCIPDCSARQNVAINMEGRTPWHIDIIPHKNCFYMLICCVRLDGRQKKYDLYAARSEDGHAWVFSPDMLIPNSYRATAFFCDDDMYIYFSRQTWFFLSWETGIVRKRLLKSDDGTHADSDNRKFFSSNF
jgi:hypothetical protein